jgi:integrase
MPRPTRGSTYAVKGGFGIRWQTGGVEQRNPGPFRTKTAARDWFDDHAKPSIRRGGPTPDITFNQFCDEYLKQWGVDVMPRTKTTVEEWLKPARQRFGSWTLTQLEGAADDIARWRTKLPTDDARHKNTRALRQVLAAAVRWRYITHNPAADYGKNPEAAREEIQPLTPDQLDAICSELAPADAAIVTFAAETGLRTNEWAALERRDIDRTNPAVAVTRRYANGTPTPYPKTKRRRVPLTPEAVNALALTPARIDTPILFPGDHGGHINLNNWRTRTWTPALEAAGVTQRGPYNLRHTFATEALAAGVPIFQLSRLMGASVRTIERYYGHLAHDSEEQTLRLLANRSRVVVASNDEPNTGDER